MKQRTIQAVGPPSGPTAGPPDNGVIDTDTLELLARWLREDATRNSGELRAAEQELAEFKRAMNESRTLSGEPVLYP